MSGQRLYVTVYERDDAGAVRLVSPCAALPAEHLRFYPHPQPLHDDAAMLVNWSAPQGAAVGVALTDRRDAGDAVVPRPAIVTCAVYHRSEGGTLQRAQRTVDLTGADILRGYPHRERLQGWPETLVYWTKATGPCAGVAPLRADGLPRRRTEPGQGGAL